MTKLNLEPNRGNDLGMLHANQRSMKRSLWALGICLSQLASPALAQNTVPPARPTEPTLAGPAASSNIPPEFSNDGRVPVDDPMLEPIEAPTHVISNWRDALDYVRTRATDYRIALTQVEAARGQARMVLANSLPVLTGNANIQKHLLKGEGRNLVNPDLAVERIPNPDTTWNLGGSLRIPVLSARNWYDYVTARHQVDQRAIQVEDAQRLIIGGLAQALVTVITTERLAEVTRVNLAAALSTLDLNQRRTNLGAGNAIDVLRARQEVETSRAQLIEADEAVRKAREALGAALGDTEAWGVTSDVKLDQLRKDARDTCKSNASVRDRADVRAAAAGAAIAERNKNAVTWSFLPTVDFVSTFTYNSFITNVNRLRSTWTIGGTLTWHLYDGGRRYGERTLNTALWEQSRQQGIQIERDATIQVRQSVRGVEVAKRSLDVAMTTQEIADKNAELARAKFINGNGSSFDLVDTQRVSRQSKLDVTVKEFELLRAEIVAFLALASCEI